MPCLLFPVGHTQNGSVSISSLVCLEGMFEVRVEILCVAGATVSYNKDAETVSLEFGCELGVGEVILSLAYVGCLNDQMRGFYRFKYTINGKERYGAATQFEVLCFPIA